MPQFAKGAVDLLHVVHVLASTRFYHVF